MTIQVNSDKTIAVDARLTSFVESEVSRVLGRFATRLTRVEIHLSDIDGKKRGQADRRCVVEIRPAGLRPLSVSTTATTMAVAIGAALVKARRSLSASFGRKGWTVGVGTGEKKTRAVAKKTRAVTKKTATRKVGTKTAAAKAPAKKVAPRKAATKTAAGRKATAADSRGPEKKAIFQARRKAWPGR